MTIPGSIRYLASVAVAVLFVSCSEDPASPPPPPDPVFIGSSAAPDPTLISFMAHPSGDYTLIRLNDPVRVHKVLDELGEVVRTLGCVDREMRFHEIRLLADGGYWALCQNPILTDLSSRGGDANGTVDWTVLQRVSADGMLEFEFNTADHFSLDDIDQDAFVGSTLVNITHGNAIAFDTDGNVLMS